MSTAARLLQRLKGTLGPERYAYFKSHPGSHLASFAVLHELTAMLPLPVVYFILSTYDIPIPFPESIMEEGNRRMSKMVSYFGGGPIESNSKVMVHMATSYAIVKAAMPLRIGACFIMTPWFARTTIVPVQRGFSHISKMFKSPPSIK
ncbi:hypothetical protein DFS34DRAFT_633858 [Phlyctochytrium arcticum]|nr:hypothetical protein DFS34DRAFT_633858 [Phlyctochytrium arcticum]